MDENKILICGAGTMGTGIAQLAAESGFGVSLYDQAEPALSAAGQRIAASLKRAEEKGRINPRERGLIISRITYHPSLPPEGAGFCLEAILEDSDAKTSLFRHLMGQYGPGPVYLTNTSSLSVSQIAEQLPFPERFAGMHFFNPAPLMPLVEVVRTDRLGSLELDQVCRLAARLGKTAVVVRDTPGFIVNRVARPYYLEAFHLAEEAVADFRDIDRLMEATGFRMGPFALTDLIGQDINFAVSESIYKAFGKARRFLPSSLQEQMVRSGKLGKKTGIGFYDYPNG